MFQKLSNALSRFFYGRNGMDRLAAATLGLSLVLLILGRYLFAPLSFLSALALAYTLFRTYSRDLAKRRQENAWFCHLLDPLRDRQHRYFRCPNCRQRVRFPRGKGHVAIRCPNCGERFEKHA